MRQRITKKLDLGNCHPRSSRGHQWRLSVERRIKRLAPDTPILIEQGGESIHAECSFRMWLHVEKLPKHQPSKWANSRLGNVAGGSRAIGQHLPSNREICFQALRRFRTHRAHPDCRGAKLWIRKLSRRSFESSENRRSGHQFSKDCAEIRSRRTFSPTCEPQHRDGLPPAAAMCSAKTASWEFRPATAGACTSCSSAGSSCLAAATDREIC